MSFTVSASAYDRFMGRFSVPLSPLFADFAGVVAGQRVLDIGCGPGALTTELVRRLGPDHVAAIDPSASFVEAARERHPGVNVKMATAESIPFGDQEFDVAIAQLVVHFLADPVDGLMEMARVTRTAGVIAACVWDHAGGEGPLGLFWTAAREIDPEASNESSLPGARQGHLGELFQQAGLGEIEESSLSVAVEYASFEDWWDPFTLGVGPAGSFLVGLKEPRQIEMRELCRKMIGESPFRVNALAWAARGVTSRHR